MPISIIKIEIHIHSKDLFSHSNKQIKLSKKSSRYTADIQPIYSRYTADTQPIYSRYTGHGLLQLSSDSTDIKEESKLQMRKK